MASDRSWERPGVDADAARAAALQDPSDRVTAEVSTGLPGAAGTPTDLGLSRVAPVIPGFEILGTGPVSAGGMGEIWKARRLSDSRAVAIKIPRPGADVAMFRRESESLRQLDHPHIVKFLDAGEYESVDGPRPYLVMEYVFDARPITRYAWENGLGLRQRLELFLQLCSAVEYLHTANADGRGPHIHRDLKPANIQINVARPGTGKRGETYWPLGQVKLIDLGLASPVEPDQAVIDRAWEQGGFGTPEYMSPEQYRPGSEGLDERSDIYALGVVLHELITGTLPYPAAKQQAPAVRLAVMSHEIERPSATARQMIRHGAAGVACECEGDLEEIVLRALAGRRADRFASVDAGAGELDLAQNIRALLESRPLPMKRGVVYRARTSARRWMRHPLAWAAVLLIAVGLGTVAPTWLATGTSWVQTKWERSLLGARPTGFERAPVLFITYDDLTDYVYLAQLAGLAEVGDAASLRKVKGLLMERLAKARPGVVMVDKWYGGPSEHDGAYLKGVEALRGVDRSVVVVADRWFGRERAEVESEISFSGPVIWGIAKMGDVLDRAWRVFAAQTGPDGAVWPSLAAAGVVHYERGPERFTYELDKKRDELVARGENGEVRRIPLTGITQPEATAPHQDLYPQTWVGYYAIEIPPDELIAARSIDLAVLMKMSPVEFDALVNRKITVIGDLRGTDDRHAYADGRKVAGVIAHGVAAAGMLLNQTITMPNSRAWETARVAAAAGLGMMLIAAGARMARRVTAGRAARKVARSIVAAAPVVVALMVMVWAAREAYIRWGVMHPPVVYMFTLVAAAALTAPLLISRIDKPWERAG